MATNEARFACGSCDKTFKTLRTRHQHLARYGHVLPATQTVTVKYYIGVPRQNLKCPLCTFKSKHVQSPRTFISHFGTEHEEYKLNLVHVCTPCEVSLSSSEAQEHLELHRTQRLNPPKAAPTTTSPSSSSSQGSWSNPSMSPPQDPPSSPPSISIDETQDCPQSDGSSTGALASPPTPERLTQSPTSDRDLLRLFLAACDDPPCTNPQQLSSAISPNSPDPEARSNPQPASPAPCDALTCNSPPLSGDPGTSHSAPLEQDLPMPHPRMPTTPSPAIPPLMANIIRTPDPSQPSTRQPAVTTTLPSRPRASDYFNQVPPSPSTTTQSDPAPSLEDLDDDSHPVNPPRPSSLDPTDPQLPAPPIHSPLAEDPASETFPSSNTADSLQSFRLKWSSRFDADLDFPSLSTLCSEFATEGLNLARVVSSQQRPRPVPRRQDRPSARPPIDRRRPNQEDPIAAKRLQHLYRVSKKRAARKVLGEDSPCYDGPIDTAFDFFSTTFGPKSCDQHLLVNELNTHVPSTDVDDTLFDPPTPEELALKLRSMANSAPGKDRLEYRHLRLLDPKCELLAKIYRHCFLFRDVPQTWKEATTILIHKKESTQDPSNFRPIALMSCLYKLLMAILARRMTSHAIDNNLLSPEQKSARPSEGCYEHSFLLNSLVEDARRINKKLNLAWLDIRNAFGSVPHIALLTTLTHMGFPPPLVEMIKNAYTGATTEVLTPKAPHPPSPSTVESSRDVL